MQSSRLYAMSAVSFRSTAPDALVVPASFAGGCAAKGQHSETVIERMLVIDA
jgi:hypothetical protein